MPPLVIVEAPALASHATALLRACGVPPEDAALIADVFVDSDLRGEESHGVRLLVHILGRLKAGSIRPEPVVTTLLDRAAAARWDANHSLGHAVAARAMRLAMAKARQHGIGLVGVRNNNSLTSLKYYPLMAVAEGMLGLAYCNSTPMMPPEGGLSPIMGNNPFALAAPAGDEHPFVLDMSCATTAKERIFQAEELGQPIPPGWALDAEGNPTTDATAALASGIVLPFGGYKAFGLGAAHEVLTSVLMDGPLFTGDAKGFLPYDGPFNVTQTFQAVDIEMFSPVAEFRARMDAVIRKIKSSRLRPGVERVYAPGERGFIERARRLLEGIPLAARVIEDLGGWADELHVPRLVPRARMA